VKSPRIRNDIQFPFALTYRLVVDHYVLSTVRPSCYLSWFQTFSLWSLSSQPILLINLPFLQNILQSFSYVIRSFSARNWLYRRSIIILHSDLCSRTNLVCFPVEITISLFNVCHKNDIMSHIALQPLAFEILISGIKLHNLFSSMYNTGESICFLSRIKIFFLEQEMHYVI